MTALLTFTIPAQYAEEDGLNRVKKADNEEVYVTGSYGNKQRWVLMARFTEVP